MDSAQRKKLATSITSLLFLVIGLSGVMMFFHFFDSYVKDLHEILGLVFILAVVFHLFYNWKQMKKYFPQKIFLSSFLVVFFVSSSFIFLNSDNGPNPKVTIIKSVLNAPLKDSLRVFNSDFSTVQQKLENEGFVVKEDDTIQKLSKTNNISPFHIVALITSSN